MRSWPTHLPRFDTGLTAKRSGMSPEANLRVSDSAYLLESRFMILKSTLKNLFQYWTISASGATVARGGMHVVEGVLLALYGFVLLHVATGHALARPGGLRRGSREQGARNGQRKKRDRDPCHPPPRHEIHLLESSVPTATYAPGRFRDVPAPVAAGTLVPDSRNCRCGRATCQQNPRAARGRARRRVTAILS